MKRVVFTLATLLVVITILMGSATPVANAGYVATVSVSSKGAPACSDDPNASCDIKYFTGDLMNTASYEFDCHGSPVHVPWFKALAAALGIDIPWWIPDPTPDSAICTYLAPGSTFKVYESGNPNPIVDKTYTGLKQEGQFMVQPNHTYELKLTGHGRDFREILEANSELTFDSFANITYQEIDPNDDICRNAIPFNLPYSGNLEFSGDHDWQRIKSPVKGTMVLTLHVPPDKDYQMEVRNDSCTAVWVLSGNGTGIEEQFVMPVDPVYYRVHIFGKTPVDFGSPYSVSAVWDLDDNQWEKAVYFDIPYSGNLEYSGDQDWQRLYVPVGGTYVVLDVPEGKNYQFELWRDDVKTQLGSSTNGSGADESILVAQPGYYRVHVFGANPALDFGAWYRVSLDGIAPSTTITLAGTMGNNGWYRSNVQVTLNATDNPGGSGVQRIEYGFNGTPWNVYSVPFTIGTEGNTYLVYRSTDNAGNVESNQTQLLKIDKTSPTISGAATTSPNSNGWYNTSVVVGFTASDSVSGIASLNPVNQTLSSEGAGQSVTGTTIDNAGNSASLTVGNINIDKTPPIVNITVPKAQDYLHSASFKIAWDTSDNLSGIAMSSTMLDNKPVTNGQTIALFFLSLGSHTVTVNSQDKAGNTTSLSVTFKVTSDINSMIAVTKQINDLGWINQPGVYNSLDSKLNTVKAAIESKQFGAAKNKLNALINELNAQKGKTVNQQAYDLLKLEVLYLLDHLQ